MLSVGNVIQINKNLKAECCDAVIPCGEKIKIIDVKNKRKKIFIILNHGCYHAVKITNTDINKEATK